MQKPKLVAAIAVALVLLGALALVLHRKRPARAFAATAGGDEPLAWCAPGLVPIRGEGCLAGLRSRDGGPVPLLVYAHGRFPEDDLPREHPRQARVATIANARGFAMLAVRAKKGECTDPALASLVCWPSNETNALDGPAFAEKVGFAIDAARESIGPGPTYLLGFSSGAYFATLTATRALLPFDAIAIAHGGPVQPTTAVGATPPLLLITADDDPSNDEMLRLDAELSRERWPHTFITREGGHELPEWDIEMAITFFARSREAMPLSPPLSTRVPRRSLAAPGRDRDAEAAAVRTDDASPSPSTETLPDAP